MCKFRIVFLASCLILIMMTAVTEGANIMFYFKSGNSNFNDGRYDKAIRYYTEVIYIDPNFLDAYYNRGVAYVKKEQYDEAIEDYNKAITMRPNYGEALFSRGVAYTRKAVSDFKKACEMGIQYACDNLKQISE